MTSFIVRTKLLPPEPAGGRLDRPRLTAVWREAVRRRCTLVVAGAGWGKTCALAQLRDLGLPVVWCTLDDADGDPAILAAHLVAGFDAALPGLGLADRVRDGGPGDAAAIVARLANALLEGGDPPVILALDDVHRVAERSGGARLLRDLLARFPPGVRVVAAGRRAPAWPLARLKAAGGLAVIGWETLAFNGEEAAAFLERAAGGRAEGGASRELLARTEGWPVALRLLAQGWSELDRQGKSGEEWLRDYIGQEILASLTAEERGLLRAAAILDRFDGPLLDQVLGCRDASRVLDRLARRGGFLVGSALGDGFFRLHHLVGDVLRERARAELGKTALREWHARAGAALLARGEHREAVEHFLQAGDGAAAVRAMGGLGAALLEVPALELLESWLARLDSSLRGHPDLRLLTGHAAYRRGRIPEALADLEAAFHHYRDRQDREGMIAAGFNLLEAQVAVDRGAESLPLTEALAAALPPGEWRDFIAVIRDASLALADRFPAVETGEWAVAAFPPGSPSPMAAAAWAVHAHYVLTPLGRLREAAALLERAVDVLRRRDPYGRLALCTAFLGCVRCERGEWEEGRALLAEGVRLSRQRGWHGYAPSLRLLAARAAVAAGDDEEALRQVKEALAEAGDRLSESYRGYFLPVVRAVLAARAGDVPRRDREAAAARAALERVPTSHLKAQGFLELAPAHLETGDFAAAGALAGEALETLRGLPHPYLRARALLLLAAARHGLADERGAASALPDALREAERCGQADALRRREAHLLARLGGPGGAADPRLAAWLTGTGAVPTGGGTVPASAEPPALRIRSLGALEVSLGGRPIGDWGRRRAKVVFKRLLAAWPAAVPRHVFLEDLGFDGPWEAALNGLKNSVSHLRRAVEGPPGSASVRRIVYENDGYRLVLGPRDWWDAEEVRRLEPLLRAGDTAAARRIAGLIRGTFLAEAFDAMWAEPVRREMFNILRRALIHLSAAARDRGDLDEAIAWLERLVREDPLDEDGQYRLMALLTAAGRREQAAARFREYDELVRREIGEPPSDRIRALVLPGPGDAPGRTPPPPSRSPVRC